MFYFRHGGLPKLSHRGVPARWGMSKCCQNCRLCKLRSPPPERKLCNFHKRIDVGDHNFRHFSKGVGQKNGHTVWTLKGGTSSRLIPKLGPKGIN